MRHALRILLFTGLALAIACQEGPLLAEPEGDTDDGGIDTESDTSPPPEVTEFPDGIELDWALNFGSEEYELALAPLPLAEGGVVIGGWFSLDVVFGQGEPFETTLTAAGSQDAFLARYEPDGTLSWVVSAGSALDTDWGDLAHPYTELGDGSIGVCGTFVNGAVFGQGETNETILETSAGIGAFVARYADDGTLEWARSVGGTDEIGTGCTPLPGSAALITGTFHGTQLFGEGQTSETELIDNGNGDVFFGRLSPEGDLVWIRSFGSVESDIAGATPVGDDGAFALAGFVSGTTVFGEGEPSEFTVEPIGSGDGYVAMYDADGELTWVNRIGGSGTVQYDLVTGAVALADGSLVISGSSRGNATFDSWGQEPTVLEMSSSFMQIYLAKYDPDGNLAWAKSLGHAPEFVSAGQPLLIAEDGSFLLAGTFHDQAVFDEGGAAEASFTAASEGEDYTQDFFITLADAAGSVAWTRQEGGTGFDAWMTPTRLADGSVVVAGYFSGPDSGTLPGGTILGLGDPNETYLETHGYFDALLARYTAK